MWRLNNYWSMKKSKEKKMHEDKWKYDISKSMECSKNTILRQKLTAV